ncbi:hypothetical protein [Methylobacillus flagellatus]|uniref:hypothetical protein n=1 Tax=Methylobacillus flagellatus TaxID=405 RepID=UPI0010F7AAF0|nr:hypothetical protein [Methylobacillus flagellatus]
MKQLTLKSAVIAALGLVSAQALATGLEPIPATGFPISGTVTTAYRLCNTTGNFGSSIPTSPTAGANNDCAVFPANEVTTPVAGFTLVTSAVRGVTINNTYTSFTNKNVGNVTEYVWRNAANTECIYGAKFTAINTDYNPVDAGNQYFEVNDLARTGFGSSGTVNAGYYKQAANASPVYRIGRTFTSVQHRAYKYDNATNKALPGTNYVSLPGLGSAVAINGENTPINATTIASTIAANQTADVDASWIDFTMDVGYVDDDGGTNAASSMTYVQAGCSASAPVATAGNIRLRQTAQEFANFIEASVSGFAP